MSAPVEEARRRAAARPLSEDLHGVGERSLCARALSLDRRVRLALQQGQPLSPDEQEAIDDLLETLAELLLRQ